MAWNTREKRTTTYMVRLQFFMVIVPFSILLSDLQCCRRVLLLLRHDLGKVAVSRRHPNTKNLSPVGEAALVVRVCGVPVVRVPYVLIGGLVSGKEVNMKATEATYKPDADEDVGHHEEGPWLPSDRLPNACVRIIGPNLHQIRRARKGEDTKNRAAEHKDQVEPVVPLANGCTHPRAIVVKSLDTVVEHGTVVRSWGLVEIAGIVVPHQNHVPIHLNVPRSRDVVRVP
mmetsp:Transcript_3775/g.11346  ORF Transcript_3775/g.11346 Transcript_3775/m.11346 type:complete len:229 (+) Transcript_3775:19-705(+)